MNYSNYKQITCKFCKVKLTCVECKSYKSYQNILMHKENGHHWFECYNCFSTFVLNEDMCIRLSIKNKGLIILRYDCMITEFYMLNDDVAFYINNNLLNINPQNAELFFNKYSKFLILK